MTIWILSRISSFVPKTFFRNFQSIIHDSSIAGWTIYFPVSSVSIRCTAPIPIRRKMEGAVKVSIFDVRSMCVALHTYPWNFVHPE
jgi:hypothetical protein